MRAYGLGRRCRRLAWGLDRQSNHAHKASTPQPLKSSGPQVLNPSTPQPLKTITAAQGDRSGQPVGLRVQCRSPCGEVPEWSIGAVSKTVDPSQGPRVRIPSSPP